MSDIDDVMERLLTDPGFVAALARDPATALAGYQLSDDDVAVLSAQVSFGSGADSRVEERISKAGTFGLLSSVVGGLGLGAGDGTMLGGPDTAPAAYGDAGEQVYLAIKIENVQVPGDVDDMALGGPDTAPAPDAGDDGDHDAVDFVAWPEPTPTAAGDDMSLSLNFEKFKVMYEPTDAAPGIVDPNQATIGDPNEAGDPGAAGDPDRSRG